MSLHKIHMKNAIRLTAVTLAATLAGCSLNPFAGDDEPSSYTPPVGQTSSSTGGSTYSEPPKPYEPVVQKVNEPVPLAEGHPNEYVVQVGDTLWDIAGTFLRDPWYWPEIWYVNPDIVNPHLIYPGDVLGLVYIDGQPRITNVRTSTYRMSPQARVTPITEAIDTIPYDEIAAFLSHGMVLAKPVTRFMFAARVQQRLARSTALSTLVTSSLIPMTAMSSATRAYLSVKARCVAEVIRRLSG